MTLFIRHGKDEYDKDNNWSLAAEWLEQVRNTARKIVQLLKTQKIKEVTIKHGPKKRLVQSANIIAGTFSQAWIKTEILQDPLLGEPREIPEEDAIKYFQPLSKWEPNQIVLSHGNTLTAIMYGIVSKLRWHNTDQEVLTWKPELEDVERISDMDFDHGEAADDFGNKI